MMNKLIPAELVHIKTNSNEIVNKSKRRLCVDHCHTTGNVRGLLCDTCNTALGKFRDNIDLLNEAIKYLKKYEK